MSKLTTTEIYGNLTVHGTVLTDNNYTGIRDSGSLYYLKVTSDSTPNLTANHTLTFDVGNVDKIVGLYGNLYIGAGVNTGAITISSNSTDARSLTLEGSITISALTAGYPLYATAGNTIGTEPYLITSRGGTGLGAYSVGDTLYYSSGTALSKLTIGTAGKINRSSGTAPTWTTFTIPDTVAIGSILAANTADVMSAVTNSTGLKVLQANGTTIGWNATTGTGSTVFATAPTITGGILAAGSITVAPLTFTTGTNLTNAAAGVMEYDGTRFYLSPSTTRYSVPLNTSTYSLLFSTAAATTLTFVAGGSITMIDAGGKIPIDILPNSVITTISTVATEVAMLALTAEQGDFCIRSDLGKTYILSVAPASVLGNWVEIKSAGGASGGAGNFAFYENDTHITVSYTIGTGKAQVQNAMSSGPVIVDAGVEITVPVGSVWTII
jgi:hypothetical protein